MTKKRIVRLSVFVFFLGFIHLSQRYAFPFQIGSPATQPWHENIVLSAFANWTGNGISLECLDAFISANRAADLDGPLVIFHALHWSVEASNTQSWQDSATLIRCWMLSAEDAVLQNDYANARKYFGIATHTIADFFSHSNWVENMGASIDGLSFDSGAMPTNFTWVTIHTTYPAKCLEKDTPEDEGGEAAFNDAYNAAIKMTKREYDIFEKRLFTRYPGYPKSAIYDRLKGMGIFPTLKINNWQEIGSVQKLGDTQNISWDHIGIHPETQVGIQLLKNGSRIGDIAEVPITNKQFSWQVGRYYTLNGATKEWHEVDPFDNLADYRIRLISVDYPAALSNGHEFAIKTFYFTNPQSSVSLLIDQNYNITWQSSDFPGPGAELFLYQNGSKIGKIADLSDLTNGVFMWNVGDYFGGNVGPDTGYEIRIQFKALTQKPYALYLKFNTGSPQFNIVLPKIAGYVRAANGSGIVSVLMSGLPEQILTNSEGLYIVSVSSGWNGTVSPKKTGYVFSPVSRTYSNVKTNQTVQSYTATKCTYSISPVSATIYALGGIGSIQVTSPSGCPWTANSNRSWLTIISGGSGKGNGEVYYQVARNTTGSSRSGSISIQGLTFSITQNK